MLEKAGQLFIPNSPITYKSSSNMPIQSSNADDKLPHVPFKNVEKYEINTIYSLLDLINSKNDIVVVSLYCLPYTLAEGLKTQTFYINLPQRWY